MLLLCEALFTVAFLGSNDQPPPVTIIVAIWWLVFRLEFGAGMIKIRGGREWRDLTALMYHHETQPMPNPISRQAHLLPKWFHRGEVLGNHFAQLVVPFLLFVPGPVGSTAAVIVILTQLWLIATGNFAWLNWITVVLAASAITDSAWHWAHPGDPRRPGHGCRDDAALVVRHRGRGIRAAPRAQLVADQEPALAAPAHERELQPVDARNAYGAFGTVTKRRTKIVVEGTLAEPGRGLGMARVRLQGQAWRPARRAAPVGAVPPAWLDWLMWFLPLGRSGSRGSRCCRCGCSRRMPRRCGCSPTTRSTGAAAVGAGQRLPLPVRHPRGVPRDRAALDPHLPARGDRFRRVPRLSVSCPGAGLHPAPTAVHVGHGHARCRRRASRHREQPANVATAAMTTPTNTAADAAWIAAASWAPSPDLR